MDSAKPLVLSRLFELTGFPIFGLDSLLVALRLFFLGASAEAELPMIFWVKSTAIKAGGRWDRSMACYDSITDSSTRY